MEQKKSEMDALSKLLRKVSEKDRLRLFELLHEIKDPQSRKMLDIKKLSGGEFYRARKGIFRATYHFETERIVIDSVRFRNEKTYRDFK